MRTLRVHTHTYQNSSKKIKHTKAGASASFYFLKGRISTDQMPDLGEW